MRIAVQMIDQETGKRTKVNSIERAELANALTTLPESERFLVMVVLEEKPEGWDFVDCPLYSVEQFIENFREQG